jgi:hypothetical protein
MFPWSPEFTWDAGHVAFFAGFYGVVLAIATSLLLAARRALSDVRLGRVPELAWHADFAELPAASRACRHQLTGEAPGRACDNGFDCRCCAAHPAFLARRAATPSTLIPGSCFGLDMPPDRLYHRGHTWVRPEPDGSVTVGLDDLGRRLLGAPERIEGPAPGDRLRVNAPALRVKTRGTEVRVLSPVDGLVVESDGEGTAVTLRVKPEGELDTRHLLSAAEVRPWVLRELERLQRVAGSGEGGVALADGGELVADPGGALPPARFDALLGEMFLEP